MTKNRVSMCQIYSDMKITISMDWHMTRGLGSTEEKKDEREVLRRALEGISSRGQSVYQCLIPTVHCNIHRSSTTQRIATGYARGKGGLQAILWLS